MLIRNMKEEDVDQVYEIELVSFSSPWSKEAIMEEITSDRCYYQVVEEQGEVLGYAGLWKILDEGHITNIAVKASYRGKGIGEKLLQSLLSTSAQLGIRSYTLEVRVSNKEAIGLYIKMGFETAGTRKQFYDKPKEDALIMWKENT